MLLKAREDGVSKKKKLKTQSIRARLASIPSRSSGVGSFAMQIKGSASRRVEGQRVVGTVEDAGQGSVRAESVKTSPRREDGMSHSGRSNVSRVTSNRGISTKFSLGKSYPPILPSNTSQSPKPSLSEVGLPTEVVGPRSSTPSPSHNKFDSSPTVISPSQPLLDIPLASSSVPSHQPTQPEMGSILSAATVRLLDPFDDDEDDDAMRRLCASPVLHPNNSISTSIATAEHARPSLRIPETQVLASSESIRPSQDKSITGRSRESVSSEAGDEHVVAEETAENNSYYGAHHTENTGTSNQRFYFTSKVPNKTFGSPPDAANNCNKLESSEKLRPTISVPHPSVAGVSDATDPARACGNLSRKISLEDRIAAIEEALAAATSPSHSSKEGDSTSQASHSNNRSGSGSTGSKKPVTDKQPSLEDRIAYLESLVFKVDVVKPVTSGSPSPPPPVSKGLPLQGQAVFRPAPVASTRGVTPPESKPASTPATITKPSGPMKYFAPPSPARRVSSASSESYEPASPAHTASSELADFQPGEFVLSSDALEAHAASFVPPTAPQVAIRPSETEVVRKPIEVEQQEGADSDEKSGDIPQFTSRVQLPPNMDVPPMPIYGQIKSTRHHPRNEPTRAHVHPSVLQHPMPRRGTCTPTASMLEESADRRSEHPLEVDLSVEYEDQPVDIAARSFKPPPKESITKVKFADTHKEDVQEAEAPMRIDDITPSDMPSVNGFGASALQAATPSASALAKSVSNAPTPEKPNVVEFGFEETDILKGLTMPSLARGDSDTSSETSDSDSQPESPAEDIRSVSMLPGKHGILKTNGSQNVAQLKQASAAVSSTSSPSNPDRVSLSRSSSRSSSPSGRSDDSESSASDGAKVKVTAAIRVSAPPIRWGGSLMKKEGRKTGQQQPRFGQRYGMQSGYSGPARSFRTFEYPSGPAGWRGSAAVEVTRSVVHPETAYDVAQEQGGNVALASFLDNYETSLDGELSSKVTLEDDMSPTILPTRKSISIIGASTREREKERKKEVEQSELDIFDELLALT